VQDIRQHIEDYLVTDSNKAWFFLLLN
jgi:hypothetical protein